MDTNPPTLRAPLKRTVNEKGGLGVATAQVLRNKGAHLALLYAPFEESRKGEVLEKAFGGSDARGVATYECDITSDSSVKNAFEQIESNITSEAFPSILVNAAGYVSVQPLEDTSAEEASKNIIPNLIGPFIVSNAFFHLYQSQKAKLEGSEVKCPPGRIVSISSQAAHVALDGHGAYCASKAGLLGLTRCQANEWGPKGITSNTVSPTVALTVLGKKAWADDKKREAMLAQIPTSRFCEPEEIADAIEYLCRDESGMINGNDLRIDGGFTIR